MMHRLRLFLPGQIVFVKPQAALTGPSMKLYGKDAPPKTAVHFHRQARQRGRRAVGSRAVAFERERRIQMSRATGAIFGRGAQR